MIRPCLLAAALVLALTRASASPPGLPQQPATECPSGPAIVLIADGAGDYRGLSTAVQRAVADADWPLHVEPLGWSHGYRRSLADQVDQRHIRAQGRRLAGIVLALRAACPARPIFLMAHSAGAAVVLAAGHCLPPDSVDRIVLLAPTVSAHADVRPALRSSRQGMDVFYSRQDRFACWTGLMLIGAEGRLLPRVAGRVGFLVSEESMACEKMLYHRLRQHGWDPSWQCIGHNGDHYGIYQQPFLHAWVLPLLLGPSDDGSVP